MENSDISCFCKDRDKEEQLVEKPEEWYKVIKDEIKLHIKSETQTFVVLLNRYQTSDIGAIKIENIIIGTLKKGER